MEDDKTAINETPTATDKVEPPPKPLIWLPTILAGKDRSMYLFEMGRAILELFKTDDFVYAAISNRFTERLCESGISLIAMAGVCNLPSESIAPQVDAVLRQTLMLLYYLADVEISHDKQAPDDKKTFATNPNCLRAIRMGEKAFTDLWHGESFEQRLAEEDRNRPKLRMQAGPNLTIPGPVMPGMMGGMNPHGHGRRH